jgi:hypothetical protein
VDEAAVKGEEAVVVVRNVPEVEEDALLEVKEVLEEKEEHVVKEDGEQEGEELLPNKNQHQISRAMRRMPFRLR